MPLLPPFMPSTPRTPRAPREPLPPREPLALLSPRPPRPRRSPVAVLMLGALALTAVTAGAARTHLHADTTPATSSLQPATSAASGPVRHVVVFKYKQTATPEQIRQVTDAFAALQGKIPGITAFEHGVNNSPEGKNLGFTHVYLMTFTDAAARDAYLPHPEHRAFGQLLGRLGILEDAFVVDYVPSR